MLILLTTAAYAAGGIKLLVNGRETDPEVAPQLVSGRVLVPVRWVAENMGATVHWNGEKQVVDIEAGPGTLVEAIGAVEEQLPTKGEVQGIWKVNEDTVLVEQVWYWDYNYYLCSRKQNKCELIVGPIESARFEGTDGERIVFIAKGGGDCGDYSFPYLLTYDLAQGELARSAMFLQRDVAFGSSGWRHLLKGIELTRDGLLINMEVAKDQVLAGGG